MNHRVELGPARSYEHVSAAQDLAVRCLKAKLRYALVEPWCGSASTEAKQSSGGAECEYAFVLDLKEASTAQDVTSHPLAAMTLTPATCHSPGCRGRPAVETRRCHLAPSSSISVLLGVVEWLQDVKSSRWEVVEVLSLVDKRLAW